MHDFPYIPYNKNLVSRARELRKETTEAEKIIWEKVLRNKQLVNLKFTRQKPLGHFIVDFYCGSVGLAIEIDGEIHAFQKARDKERDEILKQKYNIEVIRFTNEEVLNNLKKVIEDLMQRLKK